MAIIELDGESMLPYFDSGAFPDRERFAESGHAVSMVRPDGFKFVSTGRVGENWSHTSPRLSDMGHHRLAVFHLPSDPYEYVNLIETSRGEEVLDWAINTHKSLDKTAFSGTITRQ